MPRSAALLWSYSRSPGRFPSGRSHYPGRHVQVEAEQAKCLKKMFQAGVFIAIPNIATVRIRTDEDPISKREIVFARPTAVTELARWEKPIHFEEHSALARDFAFQQIQQLAHGCIGERARKAAIADQSFHMQILYRHDPTGLSDLGGQLVEPIEPDAGNLIVEPSQFVFRLQPVLF